jgi:hypothetical protein
MIGWLVAIVVGGLFLGIAFILLVLLAGWIVAAALRLVVGLLLLPLRLIASAFGAASGGLALLLKVGVLLGAVLFGILLFAAVLLAAALTPLLIVGLVVALMVRWLWPRPARVTA